MSSAESSVNIDADDSPLAPGGHFESTELAIGVAHAVLELSVGGLERAVVHLANGLAARSVRTRIIVLEGNKYNGLTLACELDRDVEIFELNGQLVNKLWMLRELTKGYLVHLHFWGAQCRPLYQLALLGRRVFSTFQNDYTRMIGQGNVLANRICALRYETVIAVSPTVRDYCIREFGIPEEIITTIQNALGHPPPPWQPRTGVLGRPVRLISVARLTPQKNHAVLLQGVEIALREGTNCMLSIIGDGPDMVNLVGLANRLNLRRHLNWYGELWPASLVQSLISTADIFVNASCWEGNPLAVLEAAAAGIPLVLSDIPPHRQIAEDDAFYFDPGDPSELAAQIAAARVACHDLARRDRCRARVLSHFSVDNVVDLHLAKYHIPPSARRRI